MVTTSTDSVTPLTSTHGAPFAAAEDSVDARNGVVDKPHVEINVEAHNVRADSFKDRQSQQCVNATWNTVFGGKCSISSVVMLACCPCVPAANIHNMLGSSFEAGVLYFGGLVFGIIISLGLSLSNTRAHPSSSSLATQVSVSSSSSTSIYGYITLVLLALLLLGVAFLRMKTRHRFNIPGYRVSDCLLSFACCWCVLSQTQSHIEKHNRHEFGLESPTATADTLPGYT